MSTSRKLTLAMLALAALALAVYLGGSGSMAKLAAHLHGGN
jgi:hypothetical protein